MANNVALRIDYEKAKKVKVGKQISINIVTI